jgi:hypothetical protein
VKEDMEQIGRLALRHEGGNWNAYYALPDTMDGAIPLGSIRVNAVINNPERKQAFMDLVRDVVSGFIEEKAAIEPSWDGPKSAPDNERSGHA